MYDVNPLGPMMHLQELERQANRALRGMPKEDRSAGLSTARLWFTALLKRLLASAARQVSAD